MSSKALRLIAAASVMIGLLAGCGSATEQSTATTSTGVDESSAAATSGPGVGPAAWQPKTDDRWKGMSFVIANTGGEGNKQLVDKTGVFDDASYRITFANFNYGAPAVQAAASGRVDVAAVGGVPPITGAAESYGFKIVGVRRTKTPDTPGENILVPKGSGLKSLNDLRGRRIAVAQGSSAHGLVLLALKSVGLKPSDVQITFLEPAPAASAFSSGKVDAWAIWNPQSALAVQSGARILAEGLPPIDQLNSYLVASEKTVGDPVRREALTDVLLRLGRAFAYGNAHPDEYAEAISQDTGVPIAAAKSLVDVAGVRFSPIDNSDIQAEQALADVFFEAGQIKKVVDVRAITDNVLPAGYDSEKAYELDPIG